MNIAGMIKRLGGKYYTVTRPNTDGSYSEIDGVFQPGPTKTLSILGSLQPMSPEDLVSVPEGDRTTERFRFYSQVPLKNLDAPALRLGDMVDVDGVNYRVETVEHWQKFTKAVIVRNNTNE